MGAPTVIAKISKTDAGNAQIAARLWDVAADGGMQTLVARTLYRERGARTRLGQAGAGAGSLTRSAGLFCS